MRQNTSGFLFSWSTCEKLRSRHFRSKRTKPNDQILVSWTKAWVTIGFEIRINWEIPLQSEFSKKYLPILIFSLFNNPPPVLILSYWLPTQGFTGITGKYKKCLQFWRAFWISNFTGETLCPSVSEQRTYETRGSPDKEVDAPRQRSSPHTRQSEHQVVQGDSEPAGWVTSAAQRFQFWRK